jgi:hypothetical protein
VILEVADIFGADLSLVVENEVVATDDSRTIRLASFKRVVMMYVKYMVSIVAFADNVVRTRKYQITPESVVLTAPGNPGYNPLLAEHLSYICYTAKKEVPNKT